MPQVYLQGAAIALSAMQCLVIRWIEGSTYLRICHYLLQCRNVTAHGEDAVGMIEDGLTLEHATEICYLSFGGKSQRDGPGQIGAREENYETVETGSAWSRRVITVSPSRVIRKSVVTVYVASSSPFQTPRERVAYSSVRAPSMVGTTKRSIYCNNIAEKPHNAT